MAKKTTRKRDLPEADKPLSSQEKLYVDAYIELADIRKAATKAGYKSVDRQAYVVHARPRVQKAIEERRDEMMQRLNITPERVLAEYSNMAFGNLDDLVEVVPGGLLVKLKKDADLSKLSEITSNSEGIKFKLHDKKAALNDLAKHLGLFEKDNEQKVGGIADAIRQVAENRKKGGK